MKKILIAAVIAGAASLGATPANAALCIHSHEADTYHDGGDFIHVHADEAGCHGAGEVPGLNVDLSDECRLVPQNVVDCRMFGG